MGLPLHEPLVVVSVCPCWAVPETVGNAVFTGGGSAAITAVCAKLAEADPPALTAVATARIVWSTSPAASV